MQTRRWRRRLRLGALSVLLALPMAEVALRVHDRFRPPRDGAAFAFDESGADLYLRDAAPLGYEHRPLARRRSRTPEYDVLEEIGAHGLREPTRPVAKPEGKRRVLVLGDSFTFGPGVPEEKTFVRRCEALLGRPDVEVLNGGTNGYATGQQYVWLRERGLRFSPDVVVSTVTMTKAYDWVHVLGQDGLPLAYQPAAEARAAAIASGLTVHVPARLERLASEKPVPLPTGVFDNGREGLERFSYLAWRLHVAGRALRERHFSPEARGGERFCLSGADPFLPGEPGSDALALVREPVSPSTEEAWGRLERYLAATFALARASGARPALVVFPIGPQVAPDEWLLGRRLHGLPSTVGLGPQRRLAAFAAREKVPFLDAREALVAAGSDGGPRFFPYDGHLTERGHEVVGRALVALVAEALEGR